MPPQESRTFKNNPGREDQSFTFNKVFGPVSNQEEVYRNTAFPLVQNLFAPHQDGLLFAYGVTSSGQTTTRFFCAFATFSEFVVFIFLEGKTYTIQGNSEDPGIVPRALADIFRLVQSSASTVPSASSSLLPSFSSFSSTSSSSSSASDFSSTSVSFQDVPADLKVQLGLLEVYNERIFDLLRSMLAFSLSLSDLSCLIFCLNPFCAITHSSRRRWKSVVGYANFQLCWASPCNWQYRLRICLVLLGGRGRTWLVSSATWLSLWGSSTRVMMYMWKDLLKLSWILLKMPWFDSQLADRWVKQRQDFQEVTCILFGKSFAMCCQCGVFVPLSLSFRLFLSVDACLCFPLLFLGGRHSWASQTATIWDSSQYEFLSLSCISFYQVSLQLSCFFFLCCCILFFFFFFFFLFFFCECELRFYVSSSSSHFFVSNWSITSAHTIISLESARACGSGWDRASWQNGEFRPPTAGEWQYQLLNFSSQSMPPRLEGESNRIAARSSSQAEFLSVLLWIYCFHLFR